MKKLAMILALMLVVTPLWAQESGCSPDEIIYISDGENIRIVTGSEMWQELDSYDSDAQVNNNAYYEGEDLVVPMATADADLLKKQAAEFATVTDASANKTRGDTIEFAWSKEWGIESLFSAGAEAVAGVSGSGSGRTFHAHFNAGGQIFSKEIKVLEVSADMTNSRGTASALCKVFGATVYQGSIDLVYKKDWHGEISKSATFWVGPIPVTVTGSVGGDLYFEARVDLSEDGLGLDGKIIPNVVLWGAADASVGLSFISVGVGGEITFLNNTLNVTGEVVYIPEVNVLALGLKITNKLKALAGRIYVFVKVPKLTGGTKKYTKDLWNWEGIEKDWLLLNETKEIVLD